uniref:Uncharacterized protein n=1 Tax=Zea mays TaxID=4577 RepID=A0A804P9Y2_MAIZE
MVHCGQQLLTRDAETDHELDQRLCIHSLACLYKFLSPICRKPSKLFLSRLFDHLLLFSTLLLSIPLCIPIKLLLTFSLFALPCRDLGSQRLFVSIPLVILAALSIFLLLIVNLVVGLFLLLFFFPLFLLPLFLHHLLFLFLLLFFLPLFLIFLLLFLFIFLHHLLFHFLFFFLFLHHLILFFHLVILFLILTTACCARSLERPQLAEPARDGGLDGGHVGIEVLPGEGERVGRAGGEGVEGLAQDALLGRELGDGCLKVLRRHHRRRRRPHGLGQKRRSRERVNLQFTASKAFVLLLSP